MAYLPGPYHQAHLYLQWSGNLPGGETWSCGLRFLGGVGANPTDAPGMLVGAAAAVVSYHQSALLNLSQKALLSSVKLNHIDVTGHYSGEGTNEAIYANLPGGGPTTQPYPNQVALAVSLTTGFSRGPAHRGRFYLPLPGYNMDANGLVAAANADACSDATDTFINALNSVNPAWDVAVFSRKLGAATAKVVTGNEVGRVYDTQRRRRRSMVEDYQ